MRRDALALVATCATLFVGARAQPGGGPGGGGGASACANPTQTSNPQAASLRGDVGCTTSASPALTYSHEISETVGGTIATNAHIYGPFDAGFSSSQDGLISNWGCSPTSLAYDATGGLDLGYEHAKLAVVCGVTLPRISGTEWKDLLGQCGGHTGNYHFHWGFECFETKAGTHSPKVGVAGNWNVYGKYENYTGQTYPYLDACGGHFGVTPDSPSTSVYHYHIQMQAPFTLGCHGPNAAGGLVTIAQCKALYSGCSASAITETWGGTTYSYKRDCPCFDANGQNYASSPVELPAIAQAALSPPVTSFPVSSWSCPSPYGVNACTKTVAQVIAASNPSAATCDASAAPANGGAGDCTNSLTSGATCQPTCNTGYTVSDATSCTSGTLAAATCSVSPAPTPAPTPSSARSTALAAFGVLFAASVALMA